MIKNYNSFFQLIHIALFGRCIHVSLTRIISYYFRIISKFGFPANRFVLFDPVNFICLKIAFVGLKTMIKRLWSAGSRVRKRISVSAARTGETTRYESLRFYVAATRFRRAECPPCGSDWCYIGFAFYAKTAVVYRPFWSSFRPIPAGI